MEYRQLGNSDLKVSVIGFGGWGIGGAPFWENQGKTASTKALLEAVDLGINFFDTAPVYGFGYSEELMGKTLAPVRDRVIIATKCGLRWKKKALGSMSKNASRQSILEEVEDSLRRLDTDRIDLYMVHWPDASTPQEETMRALLEVQKQGKVRFIGVSNYSVEQMEEFGAHGDFVSLQPEYNLLERSIENETVPWCRDHHIGIIAYSPLASGVLTGKYDKNTRFKDWRSKGIIGTFQGEAYERNIDKVEGLKEIAQAVGKTCGQMALNWVIRQPGVASALLGAKNADQVKDSVAVVGWRPAPEEEKKIDALFAA
jgi:aryl-alcohol dehydrogenase-like predicted oxidoreductase